MRKMWRAAPILAAVLGLAVGTRQWMARADDKTATNAEKKNAKKKEETAPLMCALDAMTPAERKHYDAAKAKLRAATKEVKELPNGYAFRYAPEPALLLLAAEFITKESKCCSFYTFTLEKEGSNGPLWLRITGPKGSKSFIKDALAS